MEKVSVVSLSGGKYNDGILGHDRKLVGGLVGRHRALMRPRVQINNQKIFDEAVFVLFLVTRHIEEFLNCSEDNPQPEVVKLEESG
jgi:hypothetical protein